MIAKTISPALSISEQILPQDVAGLAEAGFKSIICNRPDGESADQPNFREIEVAAKKAGIVATYQPVVSGDVSDDDAAEFGRLMAALPRPVFAYCKTGTRSTILWALAEGTRGRPLPEILNAAKSAGYDMSGLAARIAS